MRAGVCVCRIIFLTGASNNHNDSFPFVLDFSSFCALHRFRRGRSGGGMCLACSDGAVRIEGVPCAPRRGAWEACGPTSGTCRRPWRQQRHQDSAGGQGDGSSGTPNKTRCFGHVTRASGAPTYRGHCTRQRVRLTLGTGEERPHEPSPAAAAMDRQWLQPRAVGNESPAVVGQPPAQRPASSSKTNNNETPRQVRTVRRGGGQPPPPPHTRSC